VCNDPFDPVRGAWLLLMALIGAVALQQVLVFAGCILGAQAMCTRTGENLSNIAVEVLASIAVLISLGKRDGK
jgi:hypothetical protein